MKYEKNQYTEGITFCGLLLAGAFIWWGIWTLFSLQWHGIIFVILGSACLGSQIYKVSIKGKLRKVVEFEFEKNPNASVEDICKATGFSKKDVKSIILDLKGTGKLKGKFSVKTGQMKPIKKQETGGTERFCVNCGTSIKKESSEFCAFCGSKIE